MFIDPPHSIYVIAGTLQLILDMNGGLASHPSLSDGLSVVIDLHFHMTIWPFLVPPVRIHFFGLKEMVFILSIISCPPKASSASVNTYVSSYSKWRSLIIFSPDAVASKEFPAQTVQSFSGSPATLNLTFRSGTSFSLRLILN